MTRAARPPRLRWWQRKTVDFIRLAELEGLRGSIIASDPGTGKTAPAIVAAELPALVLAPASLVLNWQEEIELWRPEHRDEFDVRSYASPTLADLDPDDYECVIADEVHYLKNHEAIRTREACRLLCQADMTIAMTGTLVPNRPIELWPILTTIGATDLSFDAFGIRYADGYYDGYRGMNYRGASNLDELRELLEPYVIRYQKSDVLWDLPPKQWRILALDLPVDQREKEFSTRDLRRLADGVAFEALSTILREHGVRKLPLAARHVLDVLESEPKVVVFARHIEVLDGLEEVITAAGHKMVSIRGGMTKGSKRAAELAFQENPDVRVLLGQNVAAGVGLNLTASSRVVIVEPPWVPGELDQMADRCHRIGSRGSTLVDILTIHRSIDEAQLRTALRKIPVINQTVPTTSAEWAEIDPILG